MIDTRLTSAIFVVVGMTIAFILAVNALAEHTESAAGRLDEEQKDLDIETLPENRGGQDLIGKKIPPIEFDQWVRDEPTDKSSEKSKKEEADETPKAILYRWWTDTCPFCEASLPAFEKLRKKYESDGLRVVAVYHPKPPRVVEKATIAAGADERGFHGPVAIDGDWSVLRDLYLSTGRRPATSASFLIDADGIVRFVHPGPVLFPSDDPSHAQQNSDYQLLKKAVQTVLESAD